MKPRVTRIGLIAAALTMPAQLAAQAPASSTPLAMKATAPAPAFLPAEFTAPTLVEGRGFKLVPLGPDLAKADFAAYMSSIEHLQKTFSRSTRWPREGLTDADAMQDMLAEQARFQGRKSFAYAVLTPDGRRERGCVYVYPSTVPGHDAVIRLWVTKAEYDAGFDAELYRWVTAWIAKDWPFADPAFPGRTIAWNDWDARVAASAGKPAG